MKMKKISLLLLVLGVSLGCFAKNKGPSLKGSISSVSDSSYDKGDKEYESLRVNTQQSDPEVPVTLHVMMVLKDKSGDLFFGSVEKTVPAAKPKSNGNEASGRVEWTFDVDSTKMKRPKIIAYTVEFRCEENGEVFLLDDDYDKVDSPEDLEKEYKSEAKEMKIKAKGKSIYPSNSSD
jgi:hypothetical protein